MSVTIVKPNITDDPLPSVVPPPGYRLFPVANFAPSGSLAGQIVIEGQILNASGKPVIAGSTYDAELFLFVQGQWMLAGRPVIGASGGDGPSAPFGSGGGYKSARYISFLFGGLIDVVAQGFLRITNVQSPAELAGSMVFNVHSAEPTTTTPRSLSGTQEASLTAPSNWKTLPTFFNTTAIDPLVTVPTPVEQYVLLQTDPLSPRPALICSATTPIGDGYLLLQGDEIQWPTRDAGDIYIRSNGIPGNVIVRATKF